MHDFLSLFDDIIPKDIPRLMMCVHNHKKDRNHADDGFVALFCEDYESALNELGVSLDE